MQEIWEKSCRKVKNVNVRAKLHAYHVSKMNKTDSQQ